MYHQNGWNKKMEKKLKIKFQSIFEYWTLVHYLPRLYISTKTVIFARNLAIKLLIELISFIIARYFAIAPYIAPLTMKFALTCLLLLLSQLIIIASAGPLDDLGFLGVRDAPKPKHACLECTLTLYAVLRYAETHEQTVEQVGYISKFQYLTF